ncbi:MAG: DUF1990 domain-containing protein [Acidobacteria bacterium]|nr:DUF1990 domain-containing protein [Acidobacteriota bacterium]
MPTVSLRKPSAAMLGAFLTTQAGVAFSYAAVGATAATPPAGYVVDRTRINLGAGEAAFLAARAALERWHQFQLGWVYAWPIDAPLEPGTIVAVSGRAAGLWWLGACRIVYTVDEGDPVRRFGFAYGTLPSHVEQGEERFLVEWDSHTDRVSYDVLAFSRPNHLVIRLGAPFVRRSQRRFGRESAQAMFRAVDPTSPLPAVEQQMG